MPTIEYQTEAGHLILEQALALFAQTGQVGATAPDGAVPAACERVASTPIAAPALPSPSPVG